MRRSGLVLCAVAALSIGTIVAPAAATTATTATTLYVQDRFAPCSDTGPGTLAEPFCSIQAAADVVQPGQTVIVGYHDIDGIYDGDVHITHSGTPAQPITFEAAYPGPYPTDFAIFIEARSGINNETNGFLLDGVHDVKISGFDIRGMTSTGVTMVNSSDITIDHLTADFNMPEGIDITGTSHDVMISRDTLEDTTDSVQIGPGTARATVARNILGGSVVVNGATGTAITNNTVFPGMCQSPGIGMVDVVNGSAATSIENNILEGGCASPVSVVVDSAAAGQTSLDYNIVFTPGTPYSWAGRAYPTAAALAAGTGQGAHDLNTYPVVVDAGYQPREHSPAIDSGDANAPGFLATDYNGFTPEDDPLVPDTGTGSGYVDRGAAERTDPMTVHASMSANGAPTGGTVTATLSSTPGWTPITGYSVDFGDGSPPVSATGPTVQHVYTAVGVYVVAARAIDSSGYASAPFFPGAVTVVPPAPLVPRITVRPGPGFAVSADPIWSTDAWNPMSGSCDFGDGTGSVPTNDLSTCVHTYSHGGLYRITLAMTDPGGDTASTSALILVPANGFQSFAKPPVLEFHAACPLCRGAGTATAPGVAAVTGKAMAPWAGLSPAPDSVVTRWSGCVARAVCAR